MMNGCRAVTVKALFPIRFCVWTWGQSEDCIRGEKEEVGTEEVLKSTRGPDCGGLCG